MSLKEKSNSDMVMRKEIIITDWDGVLQMIDNAWCYMIKENFKYFKDYFDYSKLENYGSKQFLVDLFNREDYYLNVWLKRDDAKELPRHIYELFMGLYSHHDGFYHGCDWLSMMDALAGISQQNFVNEIIILTHVPFKNGRDLRKEQLFEKKIKPISPNKFRLVQLHMKESKADWIKENCPNFTVFIDDRAEIMKEVIEKNSVFEKFFIMPVYGYNRYLLEDEEFLKDLDLRSGTMSVYPVQIIPGRDNMLKEKKYEVEKEELLKNLSKYMNSKYRE